MKLTLLLFACQVNGFLLGKEIFSYDQESWDWFDAQKECKSQNRSLRAEFLKQVNSSGTFNFWSGMYKRISVWIKILGCYADNATETSTTVYKMQVGFKSAGFCQEICMSSNMSIFAMKDNLCKCLQHLPEGKGISPLLCNALCYTPDVRSEKPYFEECGGNGTYSVYISGTSDERKRSLLGTFCVAIQCSAKTNYSFHIEELCSRMHHPVCQANDSLISSGESHTSWNWSKSMQICKSMPSSSYLTGEVFLNDINRTCNVIGRELTERSWVGMANEVYFGIDRGVMIEKEDRDLFLGCQLCSYENETYKGCSFIECDIKQNIRVLCMQMDREQTEESSSQTTDILHTSTLVSSDGKTKTTTESAVLSTNKTTIKSTVLSTTKTKAKSTVPFTASAKTESIASSTTNTKTELTASSTGRTTKEATLTSTPTTKRTTNGTLDTNEDKEKAFQVIIPTAIAVGLGGVICVLFFTYLCYWKKQTSIQKQKPRHEEGEGRAKRSKVKGIINYGYFTVELQEQVISSSNPEQKLDSPFMEAKDDTYDHLRDKESRNNKDEKEHNYDTTRNIKAKIEQDKQSNDGTYDRLGDERCSTITDDTYHHAFTTSKERSEYDITEIKNQYILNSPYSHVMRIVPDESDTEQDDSSNTSEEINEDHPDFILEQD